MTALSTGPPDEIGLPFPLPAPAPQSFKCEKCGATFEDEGSAAAHIQVCKGTDVTIPENGHQTDKT